jgi:hypothetical protein
MLIRLGSAAALAISRSFALLIAVPRTAVRLVGSSTVKSNGRMESITVALAMSPAACPPMPSATAQSHRPT